MQDWTIKRFCRAPALTLAGAFLLLPLSLPRPLPADEISVGTGPGYYRFSHHSAVVLLRYERDAAPMFDQEGFWAGSFAAWSGDNRTEAISLSRGLRWPVGDACHADAELGLSWISDTTENLGTPVQAMIRGSVGRRFGFLNVSLGILHYSNAKWLFGWSGPNNGENFVVVGAGWGFE